MPPQPRALNTSCVAARFIKTTNCGSRGALHSSSGASSSASRPRARCHRQRCRIASSPPRTIRARRSCVHSSLRIAACSRSSRWRAVGSSSWIYSAVRRSVSTSNARCTASRSAMSPSFAWSALAARCGSGARSSITRRRHARRSSIAKGASRRDVIDQIAQLRVQVTRYRHMPAARVYELGSRIMG